MADRSSKSEGRSNPFMKLAGYIGVGRAPENEGANKIAMTAPVAMKRSEEARHFCIFNSFFWLNIKFYTSPL